MATYPLSPLLRLHVDSVLRAIPHLLGQFFATLLFYHCISSDSGSPGAVHMSLSPRPKERGVPEQPLSLGWQLPDVSLDKQKTLTSILPNHVLIVPFSLTLTSSSKYPLTILITLLKTILTCLHRVQKDYHSFRVNPGQNNKQPRPILHEDTSPDQKNLKKKYNVLTYLI
ncbi:hypothetical protein ILYODFUR_005413 [Ilyodon furcidens]|uniref:Uncharacterized protein n=1 Tax=Ilyodon furcidens TaxID=33524 RepID=A0ABV0UEH3_9TELE